MKKFKTLHREMILNEPFCRIEKQKVELPDGSTTDWFIKKNSDAVIVIPITKSGKILIQKNYKHGSGEIVTEFPAGLTDDKEHPEIAARRELMEETGYSAEKMIHVGEVFADPTGSDMRYNFFIARNCEKVAEQNLESSEQIEVFEVKNMEAVHEILLTRGARTSAATIAALGFVEYYFENRDSANG